MLDGIRRRFSWKCLCWILACSIATLQCSKPQEMPEPTEPLQVKVAGESYTAWLALDRIAVVAHEDLDPRELESLAARLGLVLAESYRPRIHVLRTKEFRERLELRRLAQDVASTQAWVKLAGLVVRQEGVELPLVLTEQLVVHFRPGEPEGRAEDLLRANGLSVLKRSSLRPERYVLTLDSVDGPDALAVAAQLHQRPEVVLAQPNFARPINVRQWVPNDPLFPDQWHHQNTGQAGGSVDADIDSPHAWELTRGSSAVTIAVIDDGFDLGHPDLAPNAWTNPGEIPGNGVDDDGNGFIDDVLGWDFWDGDGQPAAGAGDNHGTATAGCAAAAGNNGLGGLGSCPECGLMFLRWGSTFADDAEAFDYASAMGAQVVSNSWGYALGMGTTVVQNAIVDAATLGRGGLGCVVLFAMNNGDRNDCTGVPDISSLPEVIAVSAASNQDRKVTESAWGDCMDVLAPTHRGYGGVPFTGTLNIVTTDRRGNLGYNSANPVAACPTAEPAPPPPDARDYTYCFGGTSAATPITAGICGLILELDATLTRVQVQQLLQDTCDKIEDSVGAYSTVTGASAPPGGPRTHGYGRVNAFEAVRTVASAARAGTDVFMRDNRLDWGNTEQPSNLLFEPVRGFIPHWQSVDIKVDAPPFGSAPTTSTAFDALPEEQPIAETLNRVYVRVHNRGPHPASMVSVKLHWVFAGTALPALPSDFWTAFPGDSALPGNPYHSLGVQTIATLPYSGASVAGGPLDASHILAFDFNAPAIDPTQASPRHHCLFAVVDSPDDPVSSQSKSSLVVDFITPRDNNVTHRNVQIQDPARSERIDELLLVRNPFPHDIRTQLELFAPNGWEVQIEGAPIGKAFPLRQGEELPVRVRIEPHGNTKFGDVLLQQRLLEPRPPQVIGGFTFRYQSQDR